VLSWKELTLGLEELEYQRVVAAREAAKAAGLEFCDPIEGQLTAGPHPFFPRRLFADVPDNIRVQWATIAAPRLVKDIDAMYAGEALPPEWAALVEKSRSAVELVELVRERLITGYKSPAGR
jgi:hypothetical protein